MEELDLVDRTNTGADIGIAMGRGGTKVSWQPPT
jgi:hypothetical protein